MDGMLANNGLVAASDLHHSGGAMLPWETPNGVVEARRRFGEDEDEEFEDYDFDEDEEDYDDVEEDFDEDGEPRSPKRRKEWE